MLVPGHKTTIAVDRNPLENRKESIVQTPSGQQSNTSNNKNKTNTELIQEAKNTILATLKETLMLTII